MLNLTKDMKPKLIKTVNDNYVLIDSAKEAFDKGYLIATSRKSDVYMLSRKKCDELFGVIDVDKISSSLRKEFEVKCSIGAPIPKVQGGYWVRGLDYQCGVISGFNKAIELNKDKVFTLDDMIMQVKAAFYNGVIVGKGKDPIFSIDDFVQSIRPIQELKEIEVEIVREEVEVNLSKVRSTQFSVQRAVNAIRKAWFPNPLFDEEGCLILKKI
jgi:hypothetical protein